VLDELVGFTRSITESLKTFEHDELYAKEDSLGACPACGEGQVRETAWGYQCDKNVGAGDGCSLMVWKDRGGRYVDRKLAYRLITEGRVGPVGGFVDRYGRELEATLILERDEEKGKWVMRTEYGAGANAGPNGEAEEAVGPVFPCPCEVDGCQIVETNLRYVCKQVLDGETRKGPVLPKVVCHRQMSVEEAGLFFGEGARTEPMDGFVSKRGRPFRGLLFRKPTGKHGFEFPPREKKKPAAKKKKPSSRSKAKPVSKKVTPAKKKTAAAKKRATPAKKRATPAKKRATPAKKKATPAKKKATPATKVTPAAKKTQSRKASSPKETAATAKTRSSKKDDSIGV